MNIKTIVNTHVIKFDSHSDIIAICEDGSIWQKQLLDGPDYLDYPWEMISGVTLDEEKDGTDDGTKIE